ncbi:MAG TPA: L-histidine N(alpha)-methyltransferase [Burkholderiales bacterium]|nr:L-histidine N(alpha)-methyltransferase [Burkholderiales bacterium]
MKLATRVAVQRQLHNLWVVDLAPRMESILQEVCEGLSCDQKRLPPKLFYDRRGAQLFTAICGTQAYYPTRTENAILDRRAAEIAREIGTGSAIIEFGAGEIEKVRRLLPSLRPAVYAALDLSREQLVRSSGKLALDYPWLAVIAVIGDYGSELESELNLPAEARRVVFFPGSTIGNFEPDQAQAFLQRARALVGGTGGVLIGVDLQKPVEILDLAYNDPEGYTAAFNLNLLARLNRELGADFDLSGFAHEAFYNVARGRVEMHLRSLRPQRVSIASWVFDFARGETIHTENSYKYTPDSVTRMARAAGFHATRLWMDPAGWFGVFFLHN